MEKGVIKKLMQSMPQVGTINWIGLRPERKSPLQSVKSALVNTENGLTGDHFNGKYSDKRQVTLIQKEHLATVASILGKETVDPGHTRRNIVVSGINLLALKDQKFQIGQAILEGTGYCHPCSQMETNLGEGGYNAMRGHGGITARVIQEGAIKIGDEVRLVVEEN
ncbi:MAG: MOSC domain-containing protein [Cytophagales bacterium]|nr:MOSC domain-containing protein [Cytophagales bacterium]